MKYIFFLFPIFLQAQCLIPTHSYRLICADEVRYADSIASGSRLYISSKNAFVTSPRSVFSLVNGYGQHFIQITNSANSQKVAINRAWINRIDSTSGNKALIYIKDISVTFTSTESYTAVKDSAIACFVRAVASGLATLSDGDYGDVVVSGGGLVMTVDKPDLGLHNLADGDFSVTADSTALSLTNARAITLQTKNIDGWISRYLQTNNSLTLRANSTGKNSRIFVDTTGANFQFVNGANNASLRIGDSVAVRFNTSGSVGQVLTVTSVDGDGRLVINPKAGGSGTANCEQTLTKTSHGFRKWTPIYWNGSAWARPTYDSIIPTYIVVDSTSANTFKVANCGNYSSTLTAGLYYYKGASPGYSLIPTSIPTPLFEVAQSRLILQPLVGFNLAGGSGDVTSDMLTDTAAAIRADFPNGIISALPLGDVNINANNNYLALSNLFGLGIGRIPTGSKLEVQGDGEFHGATGVTYIGAYGGSSPDPVAYNTGFIYNTNTRFGIFSGPGTSVNNEIILHATSTRKVSIRAINDTMPGIGISLSKATFIRERLIIAPDSTFKFDPSTDLLQLSQYGSGTKEAADLSKTESVYNAIYATDGTLLEKRANTEQYNAITSTTSPQTLSSTIADNLINQGSTQATFTFRLPSSPVDGQISKATFANTVTVLTIDGNGTAVTGTLPTTVALGTQIIFKNYTGVGWVRQL